MADAVAIVDQQVVEVYFHGQVGGLRAYQIGIAFGDAEAINVGVETVGALQPMYTVRYVFAGKDKFVGAFHGGEAVGRQEIPVEVDGSGIFRVDDDVDMMGVDVDVSVVEGGESDVVDALLDGGNPHYGGVANAVAAL